MVGSGVKKVLCVIGASICLINSDAGSALGAGDTMFTKLGRGASNGVSAPAEILVQTLRVFIIDEKPFLAFLSGPVQGVYFAAVRMGAGAYEVLTFPFKNGGRGYQPVMYPETVYDGLAALGKGEWPYPEGLTDFGRPSHERRFAEWLPRGK